MCPDCKLPWFDNTTGYTALQRGKIKKAMIAYFKDHYFNEEEAPSKLSDKKKACI
jgi:hypothetical protein